MKRILALITNTAQLVADGKASKAQAESATRTATALLEQQSTESKATQEVARDAINTDDIEQSLLEKQEEIRLLIKSLKTAKADVEAMTKQSESVTREYDNLLKEHAKLTLKLEKLEYGSSDNKKDH
jgi:hypothetical protein